MRADRSTHSLEGRVAIVTGASAGLGWATVEALVARGARVIAVARRAERLAELQRLTGCLTFAGDAAEPATADAAVAMAVERYGRVDILINNAGQGSYRTIETTTVDDFDALMRSNMRSSYVFTRRVVDGMIAERSGTIVFVSSVAGVNGAARESIYCATKFAQCGFAEALDQELFPYGIKVSTIIAGGMKTEFAIGHGRDAESIAASPMMDPQAVAETIAFACEQPEGVRLPTLTVRHMGVRR